MWRHVSVSYWILPVMVFFVTAFIAVFAMMFIGVATGVFAMCDSTAPAWWVVIFLVLFFSLPIASGAWLAYKIIRSAVPAAEF